jgi:hypothetical protein
VQRLHFDVTSVKSLRAITNCLTAAADLRSYSPL